MRSCSSLDFSGVVMETSSTLVNWCWRIIPRVSLPAAPRFRAKARRAGCQPHRQLRFLDDGLAHKIGERHFGGGDEPIVIGRRKLIVSEFRQLRRPEHHIVANQDWRIDLRVSMLLARMHIEHELPECAFHARQSF